jgi:hypothetical protein
VKFDRLPISGEAGYQIDSPSNRHTGQPGK